MRRRDTSYRVARGAVTAGEPAGRRPADYADQFEVHLAEPDAHTAPEWLGTALDRAHPVVPAAVRLALREVLRFDLAPPGAAGHVLGWRVEHQDADLVVLGTGGPIASAVLMIRRSGPHDGAVTTFLWFDRSITRYLWWALGPVHRRVAPYLLDRAAAELVAQAGARIGSPARDPAKASSAS